MRIFRFLAIASSGARCAWPASFPLCRVKLRTVIERVFGKYASVPVIREFGRETGRKSRPAAQAGEDTDCFK